MVLLGLLLILANAAFVAAEYCLVSVRRTSVEGLAKRKVRNAAVLLSAIEDLGSYVAACQIGITMLGIATGAIAEPAVTRSLEGLLGKQLDARIGFVLSFLVVTYLMVVIGELCPKLIALKHTERFALALVPPLALFATLVKPLVWLTQKTAGLLLSPFGIRPDDLERSAVARDELLLMVREGGEEGVLEESHAALVSRALKFDKLDARDIMVHRLDMKWVDIGLSKDELMAKLQTVPFTRLPVCRGDIDDLAGVVYLHDIVKSLSRADFNLESILRPAVVVPENLPIDRVLEQMRSNKTQILIVLDEYGGTSGLVTLEDVVEEVFGELEDTLESERPAIELLSGNRVSARAETRFDELLSFLGHEVADDASTDTLATMIVSALGRIPRPGDSVDSPIGALRVENMARRRITRVSILMSESDTHNKGPVAGS